MAEKEKSPNKSVKRFDDDQDEAIKTIDQSVIVSASAGAGKTGVLVARLMKRCIEDHVHLNEILAVTFTKAAAADMKKKLAKEMYTALEQAKKDNRQDLVQYIQEQLVSLVVADITTIDSYFSAIIKKYYSVINLDPAITENVISDGKRTSLEKKAFYKAYKEFCNNDEEGAIKLVTVFSSKSHDFMSLYHVINRINLCVNSVVDPDTWYKTVENQYKVINNINELPDETLDTFYDILLSKVEGMLVTINELSNLLKASNNQKLIDAMNSKVNHLNKAFAHLRKAALKQPTNDYDSYRNELLTFGSEREKFPSAKIDGYKEQKKHLNKLFKEVATISYSSEIIIRNSVYFNEIAHNLIFLSKRTQELFQQSKRELACMDFSDMERFTLDILTRNNGTVAEMIRDTLKEIMVDEFQDTNELQNEIITLLSKKDNVFRVGDVKQSIYRFRQAKPSLMRSLMEDMRFKQIRLKHNYRSMNSIIQFTNLLFNTIMKIPGCSDQYSDDDNVSYGTNEQVEKPNPVTFIQIKDSDKNEYTNNQRKAIYIANQIIEMREADPSLKFGDFAVLTPSNDNKLLLRYAFDRANIQYNIDTHEGFYSSQLCLLIASMCRFMTNPQDEVSLVSVLASSFYNLSDEEFAQLKIHYGSIIGGIKETRPDILEELDELHQIEVDKDIVEMLGEVAKRHDFYDHLSNSQKANFDFLMNKLILTNIHKIVGFLAEVEAAQPDEIERDKKVDKSSEAISKGKNDDFVNVTTIHSSKGLQYPIVFLWSTSSYRTKETDNEIQIDSDLGIGLIYSDPNYCVKVPSIQQLMLLQKHRQEELEERIRLLYVAVTRAEKRLFIVDTEQKNETEQVATMTLDTLKENSSYSGLLLSAMDHDGIYFKVKQVDVKDDKLAKFIVKNYSTALPRFNHTVEKIQPFVTPSSINTNVLPSLNIATGSKGTYYGTLLHEWAEHLPNRTWTQDDFMDTSLTKAGVKDLITFSQTDLYQECIKGEVHKEYPFYIETEIKRVSGTMDFISIFNDKVILIDYKTDNMTIREIKDRYQSQLNEYIKALHIMFPNLKVHAYAYSFHNKKAIEIREIT